jgi:CheY-like chemotaxis protein
VILVVDDDPRILAGTSRLLTEAGYQVIAAVNGIAALRILGSEPAIDLLVTDVMMLGMNGPELAHAAKAARPNLAILFVSGDIGDIPQSAFEGHELLTKPFTATALIAAVERAKKST